MGPDVSADSTVAPRFCEVTYLDVDASAVIHTLAYFSIFQHPLRFEEISRYLHFYGPASEDLFWTLARLRGRGLLENSEGYYSLAGQETTVKIRKERTARAEPWLRKIPVSVRILSYLPFVEALALTGSLSKGTQDPDGDIDFLSLGRPGRLWTTRLFLGLVRRLFPIRDRQRRFCVNLFLASDHLPVRRKNLFTATEVVFVGPLMNGPLCREFFEQNQWVRYFYPNWMPPAETSRPVSRPWLKRLLEWVLSGRFGDRVEAGASRYMMRRLRRGRRRQFPDDPVRHDPYLDANEIGHSRASELLLQQAWEAALDDFQARHQVRTFRWRWNYETPDLRLRKLS